MGESQLLHLRFRHRQQVYILEPDVAGDDPCGRLEQAHDRQRHARLAGAGLPRQAEAFLRMQGERDVLHRVNWSTLGIVVDCQVLKG